MRILLIHQHYKTPDEGGGIRTWYLARSLVKRGADVVVLTAHNSETVIQKEEGYEVIRFKVPYDNSFPFFQRILAFLKFVVLCRKYLRKHHKDIDLSYVVTTPLTTGLIALYGKRKWSIPYIFEVGDLWPEVPIRMGIIKNTLLKRVLYNLEKRIYHQSLWITALSPAIKDYVEYSMESPPLVRVYPNVSDISFFSPVLDEKEPFDQNHPFKILYAGTVGIANQLESLIDIAAFCSSTDLPIQFTIMGKGGQLRLIKEKAKGLQNLIFIPHGSMELVKKEMSRHDAVFISFQQENVLWTGCPNKLMDGLAAGKLIIINYQGWVKQLIESEECGFAYDALSVDTFGNYIEPFIQSPSLLLQYQLNAYQVAKSKFDVPVIIDDLASQVIATKLSV